MADFRGSTVKVGDFAYWVERNRGITKGFRQMLSGDNPDPAQPREHLSKVQLPDPALVNQYEILAAGGMPVVG